MKTLDEAWTWYNDVRITLKRMRRMGARYWNIIPWDQVPWRSDNQLVVLQANEVIDPATNGLQSLDDLAIIVLFSVFEAIVRGTILEQVEREETPGQHRVIARAIERAKERVSEGSFFAVLDSYKGPEDSLIEEVNQVRRYRNWVAHGKRNEQPPFVSPNVAYDRLARFLAQFFPPAIVSDDWIEWLRENAN